MLQELATKKGISLPKYKTASNGASHMPSFSSTIEIGGSSFIGDVANSKKQAEMNAAKVAWFKHKESRSHCCHLLIFLHPFELWLSCKWLGILFDLEHPLLFWLHICM